MYFSTLLALLPTAQAATQALRFGCAQLVVDRLDPIVYPGMQQSGHLHQITGGNSFNGTMNKEDDPATFSTCSSCTFTEDKSNYWTAVMFFKARNGTYKRVPTKGNAGFTGANGGVTVYYQSKFDGTAPAKGEITAFPKGFRMIAGSPKYLTATAVKYQRAQLSFTCLTTLSQRSAQTPTFPTVPCAAGIMVNVNFPNCWDGKSLDSDDHMSHMSYTSIKDTPCPSTHPVKVPRLLIETVWDTTAFNNPADWPEDGSQPFVWSFGDKTGYGNHADYLFGWEGDALQRAVDNNCINMDCPTLKSQNIAAGNKCVQSKKVAEDTEGWLTKLPGM